MSYESDSDSSPQTITSTRRSRVHRARTARGFAICHPSRLNDRIAVMNTPYTQLNASQRRRVRRYRQQGWNLSSQLTQLQHIQPQSDIHIQQQAQLVVSRFVDSSNTSTISSGLTPPVMNMMPSPQSFSTGPFPWSPPQTQTTIPPFIPVAMVPTSYFTSLFTNITAPATPMVFQPTQSTSALHVQPHPTTSITPLSIINQSDVESPSLPQTSQQSSVVSSEISSTPARLLVGMTEASHNMIETSVLHDQPASTVIIPKTEQSVHSLQESITTSSSLSTSSSSTSSLDDLIRKSSYIVRPYGQVIAQSQHDDEKQPCHNPPAQPTCISTKQWKSSHDYLFDHVLMPQQRHKRMVHVTDMSGRYLSVMDSDVKQDIHPNPNKNIIQEMLMKQTSSSSSTSIQQLKQALPLSMSTHAHPSYGQQSIPSSSSQPPPTIQLITLKQKEAYERLILASTASSIQSNRHIFTPSININCIKDPQIRQRLIDIARVAQNQYRQQIPCKHQEVECDKVFTPPLDGFGISGLQVYIKSGECITWLHDELLWCGALNYMLKESQGCALWIAVGLHDLKQVMSLAQVEKVLLSNAAKKNAMEVGSLLDTLIQSGTHMEYVFQCPGQLVSSPPGNGAAHFVYSYGTLMTQIAWDYSFTIPGAVQCLSYWGIDDNHDHLAIGNTSMSTISVVPLFTMQLQGYEFGLMDRIRYYQQLIAKLLSIRPKTKIVHHPQSAGIFCPKCLYRQDWLRINNQCIHCYFKNPKILKLLQ